MAIYQFNLRLLPETGVLRHYRQIPIAIPNDWLEPERFWLDPASPLNASFDHLLPRKTSWHAELDQWGHEESDRIDVSRMAGQIADILIRIDVRKNPLPLLQAIVQFAEENGLLILVEGGHLFRPSVNRILRAMRASPAFKFLLDPVALLEQLDNPNED